MRIEIIRYFYLVILNQKSDIKAAFFSLNHQGMKMG